MKPNQVKLLAADFIKQFQGEDMQFILSDAYTVPFFPKIERKKGLRLLARDYDIEDKSVEVLNSYYSNLLKCEIQKQLEKK